MCHDIRDIDFTEKPMFPDCHLNKKSVNLEFAHCTGERSSQEVQCLVNIPNILHIFCKEKNKRAHSQFKIIMANKLIKNFHTFP